MWHKYITNEKLLYFFGGIAAATLGAKVLKCEKTREFCIKGIAI